MRLFLTCTIQCATRIKTLEIHLLKFFGTRIDSDIFSLHPSTWFYNHSIILFSNATTCPLWTSLSSVLGRQECDRLLRLERSWCAFTLSRWWWVVIEEDVVPGGALNLKSTNLPRPWPQGESSPSRKIPTVEPGIETGTSWLVVTNSDH